jgi:DNA polymerase III subunit epsilon
VRYVVLDTELTSLDHRTNRLLSVGAIAMQGASTQLGEQFYRVVNPQVSIPHETVVIHKIRSEDLKSGEQPGKCLSAFSEFVTGSVLVGHFVKIELNILESEMGQAGLKLNNRAIDTAQVHPWMLRQGPLSEDLSVRLEKLDLATLARFYGVNVEDAHHALSDAFLTARVWQRMLYTLREKKIDTLGKLLRIGGARARPGS